MERATERTLAVPRVTLGGKPFEQASTDPVKTARAIRKRKPTLAEKKARLDVLARKHGF